MLKYRILCIYLVTIFQTASAQDFKQSKPYPQGAFRYPLDLPPSTAGSFGELRPMHFHSGLDFKTQQRIGFPVHAPFDGYISRLKIQYGGFGRAVYITHPNGYTTVYGHLDHFAQAIDEIVKKEQAKQQKYEVDFNLVPQALSLKKDDVFAWSGNAGASGGPHLHFEIRDTKSEETINPQLFGLTIPDKVAPTITGISVYQLNGHPFDENTPRQTYIVKGAAGNYHLLKPKTLELSGNIGFGITAYDVNSTGVNHNGVYSIELLVDGKKVYTFAVERFAFNQTHAINAYIDYPYQLKTGSFIQKCFIAAGEKITLYPQTINRGIVTFNDNETHDVEYLVKDIAGNESIIKLKVKSSIPKESHPIFHSQGTLLHYDRHGEFNAKNIKLIVEPFNLYDDLDLIYSTLPVKPGSLSDVHRVHNKFTPIHDSLYLWIKPNGDLAKYKDKALIYSVSAGAEDSEFSGGWVKAIIHTFGDFDVRLDTIAPVITPVNIHGGANLAAVNAIKFRISDNLSGVKTFVGRIDGKWVLVEHDYKTKLFIYTFDGSIAPGKHTFELTVGDFKNNVSTYTADFTK